MSNTNLTYFQDAVVKYVNDAITVEEISARIRSIHHVLAMLETDLEKLKAVEEQPIMPEVTDVELRLMELEQEANDLRARIEESDNTL